MFEPIIVTIGCRLNAYESSVISSILKSLNMVENFAIINTCTITNESERQCRQEIRKLKKQYPEKNIIVTGCASELHSKNFIEMEEIYFVIGNSQKLQKKSYNKIKDFYLNEGDKTQIQEELLDKNLNHCNFEDHEFYTEINHLYDFQQDRARAFVPIHNGCNHYCSFCIVPFTRGKFKSIPEDIIIQQIRRFIENGFKEIVLTGIDITDYGIDIDKKANFSLGKLCKKILSETDLKQLRLSSVDVAEIDNDIIDLIANNERFMPYFHISLQSGDNEILKKMRRRHKSEDVINFCTKILELRPETAFGADIIAGFPGETLEQFQNSIEIIKNAPISYVHAFPYSKKERTLASSMDDNIPKEEKKSRVNELIEIGKNNHEFLLKSMINSEGIILMEKNMNAKARNFAPVKIKIENNIIYKQGELLKVKFYDIKNDKLFGKFISKI